MITRTDNSNSLACIVGGLFAAVLYGFWRSQSQSDGELGVWQLLITSLLAVVISFVIWWRSYRSGNDLPLLWVLGFAVLFRLLGIGAFPILEDDVYRFLWDGKQTVELGSPYESVPADSFAAEGLSESWESVLDSINYPEVGTVYGPTAQYSFAAAYLLGPGEIWALQLLLVLADVGLILLLTKMTSVRNVLLYAWSPLVIKEFAFSAHPDVLGAMFLLLGLYWIRSGRAFLAGSAMALALGVKIFAIVAIPLILLFNWRAWLSMILTAGLIALPFGITAAWLPAGLSAMSEDWVFNSPIYLVAIDQIPLSIVKVAMAALLAVVCAFVFFKTVRKEQPGPSFCPRVDVLFACLFVAMPVFNPWYLVWLLPFAAVRPTLWAWVASVSVLLAYVSGINLNASTLDLYQQPLWLVCVEFGVVAAAVIIQPRLQELFKTRRSHQHH